MRILVVTNLYPPHHLGGYEIGCRDIVEKLRARGHAVRVLTSSYRLAGAASSADEDHVERSLHFSDNQTGHDKRAECRKLSDAIQKFSPEAVLFSNQAGLSFWLPFVARRHARPAVFFLSDTTFTAWRVGAWLSGWSNRRTLIGGIIRRLFGKTFLARGWPVIEGQPCIFASKFLWKVADDAGIRIDRGRSAVVHWGIAPEIFTAPTRNRWPVRRLLFVGRISPQKGVRTAIEALALLQSTHSDLSLTLAGAGPDEDYIREMHELPARLGIGDRVEFLGNIPRTELPAVYSRHDVFVFPSEWDEPFAITPLEAMASGLAIVGTTTGGSGELLRDRETAMTFEAGNAADCARAIRELCADPQLHDTIRRNGGREVAESHTLDAMVTSIAAQLRSVAGPNPA